MQHRSAENEIAYAFALPAPACSTATLRSSTTSTNIVTTSEDDEKEDTGSSDSSGVLVSTRALAASPRDEFFRHFRKKRVVTATSLQLDVNDLKQEVANLTLLRDILASRVMVWRDETAGSLLRTVSAYYEHFRDGYRHPVLTQSRKRACFAETQRVDQAAFLQSILAPAMETGPLKVELPVMIKQWRRYSAYFALHKFHMTAAEVVITDQVAIVRTRGEFTFHVTMATITGIFPHLLGPKSQPQHRRLVDQILGRVLKCACFVDFYFDTQSQLIHYDLVGDFFGAFSSLISCPQDLVELFDGALLWEAGIIGSLERVGINDATGAHSTDPPASAQREVRKLYKVGFLLNHDATSSTTHPELKMYEYDDDERTVYTPTNSSPTK